MNPAPKTVYSDLLDEMFSGTVKTENTFKIQSWKRKAETLKSVSIFQYKLMTAILETYTNNNKGAASIAESALLLTQDKQLKAMAYRVIGNCHTHNGNPILALDAYWEAYNLTLDSTYFYDAFTVGTSYVLYDERMNDMKSLNQKDKDYIQDELQKLSDEIYTANSNNLNLSLYRDILSSAYKIYFSNCVGRVTRYPNISNNQIGTILFNPSWDFETVNLLNNQLNDALVVLLNKYDYEELLKYPIIFTSENFENRDM